MKTRGKQELCLGNYPKPGGDEGHQDLKQLWKDPSWYNTFFFFFVILKAFKKYMILDFLPLKALL
jgi:hypothetical protein